MIVKQVKFVNALMDDLVSSVMNVGQKSFRSQYLSSKFDLISSQKSKGSKTLKSRPDGQMSNPLKTLYILNQEVIGAGHFV